MENSIIGYAAATTSVFAFGIQFVHTLRSGTTLGLSFSRTVLDSLSLLLWVVYATRIEDLPLLIATAFEFITSLCVCVLIVRDRYQVWFFLKKDTLVMSQKDTPESIVIHVSPIRLIERRNSI